MKEDIKNKWIAALRSGDYQQGRYSLNIDNKSFCCLGVLCELAHKENVVDKVMKRQHLTKQDSPTSLSTKIVEVGNYDREDAYLPDSVKQWAEFKDNPMILESKDIPIGQSNVVTLDVINDNWVYDFNQIADIIEKYWKDL